MSGHLNVEDNTIAAAANATAPATNNPPAVQTPNPPGRRPYAGGIVHAGASMAGHQPLPGGSWHIGPVSRHTTDAGSRNQHVVLSSACGGAGTLVPAAHAAENWAP
jgi:hypothetical protein